MTTSYAAEGMILIPFAVGLGFPQCRRANEEDPYFVGYRVAYRDSPDDCMDFNPNTYPSNHVMQGSSHPLAWRTL